MYACFYNCHSIKILPDISLWRTDSLIDVGFLFSNCNSLESLPDISKWNIENINNFCGIFSECKSLKSLPDISKWFNKSIHKRGNNINLDNIGFDYQINDYYNFDKPEKMNGLNLSYIFYNCQSLESLPNISKWNIDNAISLKGMFCNCSKLKSLPDISIWNTDNVVDMSENYHYLIFQIGIYLMLKI